MNDKKIDNERIARKKREDEFEAWLQAKNDLKQAKMKKMATRRMTIVIKKQ